MREGGGSRSSPASVLAVAAEELGGLEFTGASHSSARGGPVACGLASKARKLTTSLHCHDPALSCTENQGPGAAPREEKDPPQLVKIPPNWRESSLPELGSARIGDSAGFRSERGRQRKPRKSGPTTRGKKHRAAGATDVPPWPRS